MSVCNFWPIGKERNEVSIFRLGVLERTFRVPRIGNGKFCARHITRIWIGVDEIRQKSSRLCEIRCAQSLLSLREQYGVRLIGADFLDRPRPKGNYGMGAFYRSIDTCILGRKTYDLSVKFGMAGGYTGKKNYVFSRTLSKPASSKVSVVGEDVPFFAERLRLEKGKDIWLVGGADLVASFLDSGQVDEFIIHVIPKMIGEGIPLVAPRHRDLSLKLLASKKFPDGVVRLHYAVRPTRRSL